MDVKQPGRGDSVRVGELKGGSDNEDQDICHAAYGSDVVLHLLVATGVAGSGETAAAGKRRGVKRAAENIVVFYHPGAVSIQPAGWIEAGSRVFAPDTFFQPFGASFAAGTFGTGFFVVPGALGIATYGRPVIPGLIGYSQPISLFGMGGTLFRPGD